MEDEDEARDKLEKKITDVVRGVNGSKEWVSTISQILHDDDKVLHYSQ